MVVEGKCGGWCLVVVVGVEGGACGGGGDEDTQTTTPREPHDPKSYMRKSGKDARDEALSGEERRAGSLWQPRGTIGGDASGASSPAECWSQTEVR
ncbi:hypothetical protein E2C01_048923 [Portunus trituberculatus]|uniref:Uncharacterized protein n=1 Tax=Portunus trituberculatus TaxID=210409 RepID=A0A5B7G7U6_PORTR|nr:hypothetical protein [Portunus trituberculatus]